MLFNSLQFLVFFPLVVGAYFLLPQRRRWILLLGASYYFYMSWKPEYVLLILFCTAVNYVAGRRIGDTTDRRQRDLWLATSLVASLGVLFAFKYFNLFNDSLRLLFSRFSLTYQVPVFQALLPVGISFYTFQALSYVIDVYRGQREPETHFGIFALYVAFFPQLVAGPIERSLRLLPQLRQHHRFDLTRVLDGLKLMAWGFFKKLVIADRLAEAVDFVYAQPGAHSGVSLTIATLLFAYQIYCDFSGYSDIAIGAAQVMGIDLMQNFRQPYFARSIPEFWRRWHISLSTWFRDYLYIPLGGNRVSRRRWQANLLIVFVISGLWHGASWTFVIWGALHGFYMLLTIWIAGPARALVSTLRMDRLPRMLHGMQLALTFFLVTFAWIFFRAQTVADATYIATHFYQDWWTLLTHLTDLTAVRRVVTVALPQPLDWLIVVAAIVVLEAVHVLQQRGSVRALLARQPIWVRWPLYYGLVFSVILFGKTGAAEFIYFRF